MPQVLAAIAVAVPILLIISVICGRVRVQRCAILPPSTLRLARVFRVRNRANLKADAPGQIYRTEPSVPSSASTG